MNTSLEATGLLLHYEQSRWRSTGEDVQRVCPLLSAFAGAQSTVPKLEKLLSRELQSLPALEAECWAAPWAGSCLPMDVSQSHEVLLKFDSLQICIEQRVKNSTDMIPQVSFLQRHSHLSKTAI